MINLSTLKVDAQERLWRGIPTAQMRHRMAIHKKNQLSDSFLYLLIFLTQECIQIVGNQYNKTDAKEDNGVIAGVFLKELADHPNRVSE